MGDQVRDTLNSLLENLICDMKCLDERSFLIDNREDLVIRYSDECIDFILEGFVSFIRLADACWSFE